MTSWLCTVCGHKVEAIATEAYCSHKGTAHANGKFKSMKFVGGVLPDPVDEADEVDQTVPLAGVCTKIVRRDRGQVAAASDGEARFIHEPCSRPTNNGRCERHAA